MKNRKSVYWASLSIVAAAICCGVPWNTASAADESSATSAPAVAKPVSAPAPGLAYGVSEVLKMYQGGIGKDVILNYIANTALPYHLTADGIIYMQAQGVPQDITKALLQRDGQLQQQAAQAYQQQAAQQAYQQQPPPPGNESYSGAYQQQPVEVPTTPAPVVTYTQPVYPAYSYASPYPYYDYGYPYGYWPPVVIGGFGWGWGGYYRGGWGGGGFHGGIRGGGGGFHGGGGGFHGGGGGGFHGGGGGGFHGGGRR
jgi:hypothetical protein